MQTIPLIEVWGAELIYRQVEFFLLPPDGDCGGWKTPDDFPCCFPGSLIEDSEREVRAVRAVVSEAVFVADNPFAKPVQAIHARPLP